MEFGRGRSASNQVSAGGDERSKKEGNGLKALVFGFEDLGEGKGRGASVIK